MDFKVLLLVYKSLKGLAPDSNNDSDVIYKPSGAADPSPRPD